MNIEQNNKSLQMESTHQPPGRKRKKKHVGGKKEKKKNSCMHAQDLNSRPSRFPMQYTNALS